MINTNYQIKENTYNYTDKPHYRYRHRPTTTMQSVGATDTIKHRSILNEKCNLWKYLQTWQMTTSGTEVPHSASSNRHFRSGTERLRIYTYLYNVIVLLTILKYALLGLRCLQVSNATQIMPPSKLDKQPRRRIAAHKFVKEEWWARLMRIPGGCWGLIKKVGAPSDRERPK